MVIDGLVSPFDFVFFTPYHYCGAAPYPPALSGFLDAHSKVAISAPVGRYFLCLRQNNAMTLHSHVMLVAVYSPSPPPPSLPPPPPCLLYTSPSPRD